MEKRRVVENVVGRMYRHYEKSTGRTPDAKTVRAMEDRAKSTALLSENKKKRR